MKTMCRYSSFYREYSLERAETLPNFRIKETYEFKLLDTAFRLISESNASFSRVKTTGSLITKVGF